MANVRIANQARLKVLNQGNVRRGSANIQCKDVAVASAFGHPERACYAASWA